MSSSMEFHEHIERCVHWQGLFVSDRGVGYPYVAYAILSASPSSDPTDQPFERTYVEFNSELLTPETHAYLEEHGDEMTASIVSSFARLWVAEGRRAGMNDDSTPLERPRKGRPSRRQRRAKAKLWASIDEFLRQERQVTRD